MAKKISIALEEMGLEYQVHQLDLASNQQKQAQFLAINLDSNGHITQVTAKMNDSYDSY